MRNALSSGTANATITFGNTGDLPITGDWNCDGLDTPGVFRPSNATFYLTNQATNGAVTTADISFVFGQSGDVPFTGDWNGDGCTGVAVFRSGTVLMKNTLAAVPADIQFDYGIANNDRPLAGVWTDGSGGGSTQPASLMQLRTASQRYKTSTEQAPAFNP